VFNRLEQNPNGRRDQSPSGDLRQPAPCGAETIGQRRLLAREPYQRAADQRRIAKHDDKVIAKVESKADRVDPEGRVAISVLEVNFIAKGQQQDWQAETG